MKTEAGAGTLRVGSGVALVTGGSRGIGASVVRALSAAGWAVVFSYRDAAEAAGALAAELGERCAAVRCDVADAEALPALVEVCVERFGGLDVLVNNAGIYEENPFDGVDYARWRAGWARTFAVNTFGPAHLVWLALREFARRPAGEHGVRGRVINISSRSAHRGELTFADYAASKAALGNLTKSVARACARDGIVAFTVAPGFIETDMASAALALDRARFEAEIPAGRIGSADEVASIVALLAGGGADYATGTTIDVNGASYLR